jgi:hypothetical protein
MDFSSTLTLVHQVGLLSMRRKCESWLEVHVGGHGGMNVSYSVLC